MDFFFYIIINANNVDSKRKKTTTTKNTIIFNTVANIATVLATSPFVDVFQAIILKSKPIGIRKIAN